jgi:glycosyltransferase involved in cell wall biosynthesis
VTKSQLVSIVIPCFNYGRFLGEAIQSALDQTHQPIEVIVVDDGSTDDTKAVASRYAVRLIALSNCGVCAAANAGFAAATGEFVLRLDADDRLAPMYVEETLSALQEHPDLHFAYTACSYYGARTGTYPVEPFDPETLAERNYINASALMRRASLQEIGGYSLNMRDGRYEDWDLWLTFAERGMPGALVDKPLLLYRQHAVPTRGTLRLKSWRQLRSEIHHAQSLQANHPRLLATPRLVKRLCSLPRRVLRGNVSPRFAMLLLAFYAAMLLRSAGRLFTRLLHGPGVAQPILPRSASRK